MLISHSRTLTLVAGIVAALLAGSGSTASAGVILTPLGDLPGGQFDSRASAVSADGLVVVGDSHSASGSQTFRWTAGSGMVGLGVVPGGNYSHPSDVSSNGSLVVGISGLNTAVVQNQAFRWTAGSGMVALGTLPGETGSFATGVSGDGSVVVGSSRSDFSTSKAFRWTAGTGMVALGNLPGSASSAAEDISSDGSIVVGASGQQAFRWTEATGMVGLGFLPGGTSSRATHISADGSVIVGRGNIDAGLVESTYRRTADSQMTVLGLSRVNGISADGSVIVGVNHDEGDSAAIWTAGSGRQELWSLLMANGANPAADGWTTLLEATGVSADGRTIVGYGNRSGGFEAFVATVPEPASLGPIIPLATAMLRRGRRRSGARCTN